MAKSIDNNALYLASLAKIYDVSQMRKLKQLQYKTLLLRQQHLGFHRYDQYQSYNMYLRGPRTREFDSHNRHIIRGMEEKGSTRRTSPGTSDNNKRVGARKKRRNVKHREVSPQQQQQ
jgi:hypothetical protein